MRDIIIRPLLTEKMTGINESLKKYGFIVDFDANKIEIARALKKKFEVDAIEVNTMKYKGKSKTQMTKRGRFTGKTPRFKKAIITLKEGQKIDIFGEV